MHEIGTKGLFTAEIERALAGGSIDLAVHSLKDLPTGPTPGISTLAIPRREDPRDVLVVREGLCVEGNATGSLAGARIGTSSLRRTAQIRRRFPEARAVPLRGNVETRIGRLAPGGLDAAVLAVAGLRRLGLRPAGTVALDPPEWLPAPGQGALAIQGRVGDGRVARFAALIDDETTRAAVSAERAFLAGLEGGCHAPIAALAIVRGKTLELRGALYPVDDSEPPISATEEGDPGLAVEIGKRLAERFVAAGGRRVIEAWASAGGSHPLGPHSEV